VDIELLTRINNVIADGTSAYGKGFTNAVSAEARKRGAQEYRYVTSLRIRPSEDLGHLANAHLRGGRLRGDPIVTKRLFQVLGLGSESEADLASYLLFDGPFCRRLIDLGRADARARRDELLAFFRDDDGRGGGATDDGADESGRSDRDSLVLGT
jgi:NTE family protein